MRIPETKNTAPGNVESGSGERETNRSAAANLIDRRGSRKTWRANVKPILLRFGQRILNTACVAGVQRMPTGEVVVYLAYTDLIEPGDWTFLGAEADAVWSHFSESAVAIAPESAPNQPAAKPVRMGPAKAGTH